MGGGGGALTQLPWGLRGQARAAEPEAWETLREGVPCRPLHPAGHPSPSSTPRPPQGLEGGRVGAEQARIGMPSTAGAPARHEGHPAAGVHQRGLWRQPPPAQGQRPQPSEGPRQPGLSNCVLRVLGPQCLLHARLRTRGRGGQFVRSVILQAQLCVHVCVSVCVRVHVRVRVRVCVERVGQRLTVFSFY